MLTPWLQIRLPLYSGRMCSGEFVSHCRGREQMGNLHPTSLKQSHWANPSLNPPNYRPVAPTITKCCCKPPSPGFRGVCVCARMRTLFKLDFKSWVFKEDEKERNSRLMGQHDQKEMEARNCMIFLKHQVIRYCQYMGYVKGLTGSNLNWKDGLRPRCWNIWNAFLICLSSGGV